MMIELKLTPRVSVQLVHKHSTHNLIFESKVNGSMHQTHTPAVTENNERRAKQCKKQKQKSDRAEARSASGHGVY